MKLLDRKCDAQRGSSHGVCLRDRVCIQRAYVVLILLPRVCSGEDESLRVKSWCRDHCGQRTRRDPKTQTRSTFRASGTSHAQPNMWRSAANLGRKFSPRRSSSSSHFQLPAMLTTQRLVAIPLPALEHDQCAPSPRLKAQCFGRPLLNWSGPSQEVSRLLPLSARERQVLRNRFW